MYKLILILFTPLGMAHANGNLAHFFQGDHLGVILMVSGIIISILFARYEYEKYKR